MRSWGYFGCDICCCIYPYFEKKYFFLYKSIYIYMCYGFIIVKINCYWLPVKLCFQEWNLWPFKLLCVQRLFFLFFEGQQTFFKFEAICLYNNFVKLFCYFDFKCWKGVEKEYELSKTFLDWKGVWKHWRILENVIK